ncbi:hypothetical protein [Microcoleus sp. F4-D5]
MRADQTTHSTLTPGSKNNELNQVKYLQEQLNIFYHTYISVDGEFGNLNE